MHTIGLLGGTFDPIHFGHLRTAQELSESLRLNELRFIPSSNPPHKAKPQVTAENRAAMVKLAIIDNPIFKFDGRELLRIGSSYTIDTLLSLRAELGDNVSLILIMGSDAFIKFNTWYRWQEIIKLCNIALVQRPLPTKKEALPKELEIFLNNHYTEHVKDLHDSNFGYVTMQAITPLEISSTAIRDAIQHQNTPRYLLPDGVLEYIHSNRLYNRTTKA